MKTTSIFLMILLVMSPLLMQGQEIKSKKTSFHINNMPVPEEPEDTVPPFIAMVSPPIPANGSFVSNRKEMTVVGRIRDASSLNLVSFNSEIIELNDKGMFNKQLILVPGTNTFNILAMDDSDNMSQQSFTIDYQVPEPTLAEKISEQSDYYALIIGINQYRDKDIPDLEHAIHDAGQLHDVLVSAYRFKEENVRLIKNASRADIIQSLDEMAGLVGPEDNLLIFYAGHGWWDADANNGYWLPSDADRDVKTNWFRNSTLVDYLKEIKSRHTLLITDACFGGSIFSTRSAFGNKEKAYEKLYQLPSRKAMTSGNYTEVPDQSSFSEYLIRRLEDNREPYLSSEQLFSSFRIAVINNSDAIPQYGEIKNVGDEGGDFIFLKKSPGP